MDRENKILTSTARFEIIAPLLADGLCDADKRRIRAEILEKHGISERTLRRWLESYRKYGLEGLEPAGRPEAGTFKAIPQDILEIAMECRKELPERSVRNIVTILEKEGHVEPGSVSRSTLSHNLLALGHSTKQLRNESGTKAARRFVRVGRNTLWQSDVKFGLYVPDDTGKNRRTYLASFIDDCTRVVPHSEWYFNHRVPVIEDCFRKGMLKFGKPDSVYVDQGQEFTSKWMRIGCARLGIKHLTAKPYSPESKDYIAYYTSIVRSLKKRNFESLATFFKLKSNCHPGFIPTEPVEMAPCG